MASLTLTVGQISSTRNATDQNTTRILEGLLNRHGYDVDNMTAQEKADAVIDETVKFYKAGALSYEVEKETKTARNGVIADPPEFS